MTQEIAASWSRVILVCAECAKRVRGGFGPKGRTGLVKALRRELGVSKGANAAVGVAAVECLGVCPRDAVVALDAARPGRWLEVRPGTPAADVLAALDQARPTAEPAGDAPPQNWRAVLRAVPEQG